MYMLLTHTYKLIGTVASGNLLTPNIRDLIREFDEVQTSTNNVEENIDGNIFNLFIYLSIKYLIHNNFTFLKS